MTELWLIFAGLSLIALLVIFFPLIKPHHSEASLSDKQQNIDIFKQRLAELEYEKLQGNLNEDTFLQLKIELEKSLLTDVQTNVETPLKPISIQPSHWMVSSVITLLVIGISFGIYLKIGRSDDFALSLTMNAEAASEQPKQTATTKKEAPSFDKIIVMLEQKLQKNPNDLEKWFLLANTYSATGKFAKSADAFSSAMKQMPKDDPNLAAVMGSYAQMLFQAAGEVITPEIEKAMNTALTLDPLESSALIIKGIQAYTAGDLKTAVGHWEKAKTKASPQLLSSFIEPVIAQTNAKLGQKPIAAAPIKTAEKTTAKIESTTSAHIEIKLDISRELKAKTKADDIIFVFAQKMGGRMPLAAERLQVKDLPKTIILDDTKSPMPSAKLSSVDFVSITARVSFAGRPQSNKGDLFIKAEKVAVKGAAPFTMLINQVVE
ncbi:MAG: c-type cytochrome biogenesis protein CcmI [Methylococcales bacterium]|nr:c-type cytochrome biogenesis protein CcmI [Methylococcales bacterium]